MITVLATATSDLLASVADTKEAMDLTDAVNDEKLKRFIRRASAQIEQFCNRPLLAQTYRAMLPSYGGPRLQLPHYPIRKVLAVYEGSDTGAAVLVSTSDYTVNDQLAQLERADGWGWSAQVDNDISIGPVGPPEGPSRFSCAAHRMIANLPTAVSPSCPGTWDSTW